MADRCPICLRNFDRIERISERDAWTIVCRLCGEFQCPHQFLAGFPSEATDLRPYLSAHTRQTWESGNRATLDYKNWKGLAEPHSRTDVPERLLKLLLHIQRRSSFPGELVPLDAELDYPLVDAPNRSSFVFIVDHGVEEGYLHWQRPNLLRLEVKGINHLKKKGKSRQGPRITPGQRAASGQAAPATTEKQRDLLNRLRQTKEDSFTERKTEANGAKDWRPAIVAFANSVPEGQTAVLYVGVADDGEVVGVADHDLMQKTLNKICKHDCYPPITSYDLHALPAGVDQEKWVIAVEVHASKDRPHFAGLPYVRKGSETVPASRDLFDDLIASRNDKARAILRSKRSMVTVELFDRKLESPARLPGYHVPRMECFLVGCDAFAATLEYDHSVHHIPLGELTVSKDAEWADRLKLIIRPPQ